MIVSIDSKSVQVKKQVKQDILKEISGYCTQKQIEYLSNVFDNVADGYIFSKKQ